VSWVQAGHPTQRQAAKTLNTLQEQTIIASSEASRKNDDDIAKEDR